MSIWSDIGSVFTAPVEAVKDVASFLQWVSWLFNPINWLRAVEFQIGFILFGLGLWLAATRRNDRQAASTIGQTVRRNVVKVAKVVK